MKYCLRQKRNLVRFINHYSEILDHASTKVHPSDELVGGKIILIKDSDKLFGIIKNEKNNLIKAGNEAYDMLFITPPSLVNDKDGYRCFKLLGEFERNNILLWDGTNDDNRLEFSVDMSESRIVQYESSRGLEGWTVCCLNYDEFMQIKERQFDPNTEGNALFLQSAEETKKKYLLNWALLPMTRAIDTLIITLKDDNNTYSESLLRLAEQHPDYVRII